jgi:hypothetical protein
MGIEKSINVIQHQLPPGMVLRIYKSYSEVLYRNKRFLTADNPDGLINMLCNLSLYEIDSDASLEAQASISLNEVESFLGLVGHKETWYGDTIYFSIPTSMFLDIQGSIEKENIIEVTRSEIKVNAEICDASTVTSTLSKIQSS